MSSSLAFQLIHGGRSMRIVRPLLLASLLVCTAAPLALLGQSTRPDRGNGNGPQHVADLDNVNLQNGSVSITSFQRVTLRKW
jgi:hypothetical protein